MSDETVALTPEEGELKQYTLVMVAIYNDPEQGDDPEDNRMQSFTMTLTAKNAGMAEKMCVMALGDLLAKTGCEWEYIFPAAIFPGKLLTIDHLEGEEAVVQYTDDENGDVQVQVGNLMDDEEDLSDDFEEDDEEEEQVVSLFNLSEDEDR